MTVTGLQPGDVICVRTDGAAGELIRIGEELGHGPGLVNHVLVVHHFDDHGILWAIEGRPGGVGWVQAGHYLGKALADVMPGTSLTAATNPLVLQAAAKPLAAYAEANTSQPKTPAQRAAVCDAMQAAIGTPYDWGAIAQDAVRDLHLPALWAETDEQWGMAVPAHVVCSSVAAWGYQRAGLPNPAQFPAGSMTPIRFVQPSDWLAFMLSAAWGKR